MVNFQSCRHRIVDWTGYIDAVDADTIAARIVKGSGTRVVGSHVDRAAAINRVYLEGDAASDINSSRGEKLYRSTAALERPDIHKIRADTHNIRQTVGPAAEDHRISRCGV